ncbi:type II toxin-antitoxin system RelE/ParE family toxin [Aureimonas altamirensis]|uniref:type II toxin-antitoxin system RelE/ParE family toxin n=1 Tax=Aureimonas altamirensis TaxID=370622 RepID=UPI0020369C6E|nr:type II toxin-antitoxin system RelE/ParE family toxin [Aureimonas altamirensis]MCM2505634.1 type II toxin-antitoxin system RelE/ParE family toxin [Aureimonas altamirensis]
MKLVLHPVFEKWLSDLRDRQSRSRILTRLSHVQEGNFGDHKSVGDGVSELRFAFGPGYRVYYTRRGNVVVIMLCGGDKGSQQSDIRKAKALAAELEDGTW